MVEIHLVKLIFAFGEYRKFGLIFSNGLLLLSEYCLLHWKTIRENY